MSDDLPRIGLFWVAPNTRGVWTIYDLACPAPAVPLVGGFRTHEVGHVQAWARLRGSLSQDYGDYPRGRVNWRAEDERYLLLLDPVLLGGWHDLIAQRFHLPAANTLVMTDSHNRSCHRPPEGACDRVGWWRHRLPETPYDRTFRLFVPA